MTEGDGIKAKPNVSFKHNRSLLKFYCVVSTVKQQGAAEESYEGLQRWNGVINRITVHLTSFSPNASACVCWWLSVNTWYTPHTQRSARSGCCLCSNAYIQYIYVFFLFKKTMALKSSSYSVESGWITKSFTSKISQNKAQKKNEKIKRAVLAKMTKHSLKRTCRWWGWREAALAPRLFSFLRQGKKWMKKAGLGVADGEAHAGTRAGSVC